jgi:Bacteriophage Lambda NinG protein
MTLKKRAETVFHHWILKRDNYICYTCGHQGGEAGHYWHNKLDFDERNLHCQCTSCNRFKSGNLAIYAHNLIRDHGHKWFDKLDADAHQSLNKFSKDELEEFIQKYS